MDKNYKEQLIKKYLNNQCTEEELEEVAELFKKADNDSELLEIFGASLESSSTEIEITEEHNQEIWNKIKDNTQPVKTPTSKTVKFYSKSFFRVASIVLLVLCATYFLSNLLKEKPIEVQKPVISYHTEECKLGKKSKLTLPDGSVAYMNAGTKITYPSKFEGNTRQISLSGEAFFDIVRDEKKPFIIESNNVYTKVLGTSFNLSYYENEAFELTLVTGKVKVSTDTNHKKDSVVILPNHQVSFNEKTGSLATKKVDVTPYTSWKEGKLVLKGDLATVTKKIERWYNKKIVLEKGLEKCSIDATYKNQHINNVIKGLAFILELQYTINGDTIYLKGKGC